VDNEDEIEQNIQNCGFSELDKFKLHTYLSTPRFVKALTDVSTYLAMRKDLSKSDKMGILKTEIRKINKHLPAQVYVPFVNNSVRNHSILHILENESRIFQTKERAPFLICLEAFRPEEVSVDRHALFDPLSNVINPYLKEKRKEKRSDSLRSRSAKKQLNRKTS